ncbi:MAG: hypothetical protein LAT84_03645 [Balneolia bacterium]|nr:hypothetical protein [Balneolia bacterium]
MLRFTSSEYKKVATLAPESSRISYFDRDFRKQYARQSETTNPTFSNLYTEDKSAEYFKKTSVPF